MAASSPPLIHLLLELLAYAIGVRLYWASRDTAAIPPRRSDRVFLIAGAACGAAIVSKGLYIAQYSAALAERPWPEWLAGKTVVGGLLGGWLGVELAKLAIGWHRSTGDRFVLPFAVAVVIGRLGCQLSGPWDLTYGVPTTVPWGWDYGDGVARHPVAAYEMIGVLAVLASMRALPSGLPSGNRFRVFIAGYLALRLGLDFLKPPHGAAVDHTLAANLHLGLTAIQWACIAGILGAFASLKRPSIGRAPA